MSSTYRVQLHRGFDLDDAAAIVDYLAELGVSHLYLSPILTAQPGSTHGYDVVDPTRVNPELGGEAAHGRLTAAARAAGLGQYLDIVPNHMATGGRWNRWWWDVLENGPSSAYASHFDIDWDSPDPRMVARVLVPVLGDHYGRVLERRDFRLAREGGTFTVGYFEHDLPVSPRTVDDLLARAAARASTDGGAAAGASELADLAAQFGNLPHAMMTDPDAVAERHRTKHTLATQLDDLCTRVPGIAAAVDAEVAATAEDLDCLDELLARQNYRLAHWRTAAEELDYRRFFNIETLVGMRVERERVFADTHPVIIDLVRTGTVDGLRVDHVDGLRDPRGYLGRLAAATGAVHVVVEKILLGDEDIPASWPVAGTTGYDFLALANGLFVDPGAEGTMTATYVEFTRDTTPYPDLVHDAKVEIMTAELATEVDRLTAMLAVVCDGHRRQRDHTRRDLRRATRELIAAFPVYRTYPESDRSATPADRTAVDEAVAGAMGRNPDIDVELLPFIGAVLLGDIAGAAEAELAFRFAQTSGAVMAKGVEDTAFYRYNRLVSLNEVGGDPGRWGTGVEDFHRWARRAAKEHPAGMLTLETHDTKRSADVRARINALTEVPAEWEAAVAKWSAGNGGWADPAIEYLLYQTLVGAWPIEPDRVVAAMRKSSKEAKVHTSWVEPDEEYDAELERFVRRTLDDPDFVAGLEEFLARGAVVQRGRRNSMAQTALLLTAPGRPDIYQGAECWNHTLVDPDNRRAVDYGERRRALARIRATGTAGDEPKLGLIHALLHDRAAAPGPYEETADYEPRAAESAVAFARGGELLVAVARGTGPSVVDVPQGRWRDVLSGAEHEGGRRDVLGGAPVAVLRWQA